MSGDGRLTILVQESQCDTLEIQNCRTQTEHPLTSSQPWNHCFLTLWFRRTMRLFEGLLYLSLLLGMMFPFKMAPSLSVSAVVNVALCAAHVALETPVWFDAPLYALVILNSSFCTKIYFYWLDAPKGVRWERWGRPWKYAKRGKRNTPRVEMTWKWNWKESAWSERDKKNRKEYWEEWQS